MRVMLVRCAVLQHAAALQQAAACGAAACSCSHTRDVLRQMEIHPAVWRGGLSHTHTWGLGDLGESIEQNQNTNNYSV